MSRLFLAGIVFFICIGSAFAGDNYNVRGTVTDESSKNLLSSAKVEILELGKVTETDILGRFEFANIPEGNYNIRFSAEGYVHKLILIKVDSSTSANELSISLRLFESILDTIDVHAGYFKKDPQINTSYNYAEYDELRKTPGAIEDIVKYFQSSPGVSSGNDQDNDIICRGGSPLENLTLIDGIEIENPNHYGPPGSTSGMLSYINPKLIQEVDFYSGGFPVKYGERLSSVMDIKFKEGSMLRHFGDAYISVTGFGGFAEGPLSSKSSYMVSIRRSYFELLKDVLEVPLLPNYWDANLKLNYKLGNKQSISFVGVFAFDKARPYKQEELNRNEYVDLKIMTYGFNFLKQSKNSSFNAVLSHAFDDYRAVYDYFRLNIKQHQINFKLNYSHKISDELTANLFYGNKFYVANYNVTGYYSISYTGYELKDVRFFTDLNTFKIYGGFNMTWNLLKKLTANAGARLDYLDYMTNGFCISPRMGLSYKVTERTFLNLNLGYYYQPPEFLWLLSRPGNKNLSFIKSSQIVIGTEHFLFNDLRINVEAYHKFYTGYPVSIYDPMYLFLNGNAGIYPDFLSECVSKGRGYFTGIDFTIQRKNNGPGFYGFLTYSYTKSKFYALSGGPQTGGFDFGNQLVIIGGWKIPGWAFSFRTRYADGKPFTPFDSLNSVLSRRGVYDMSKYMADRLPYYLRFDVRIDKEFTPGNSKLTLYLEVQNLFNRTNLWGKYWSWTRLKSVSIEQWSRLLVGGVSFRF